MTTLLPRRFGMGCMRLSDISPAKAAATIQAGYQAGVRVFDTADAYHAAGGAPGDNERLLRRALTGVPSDDPSDTCCITTKVGLVRRGTRWIPTGTRKHLLAAAEASAERLGAPPDILFLHVIDPRVAFKTQLNALRDIQARGLARTVGLSNVTVPLLDQARQHCDIKAVQIPLSPFHLDTLRSGLLNKCAQWNIDVYGYRPLGGGAGALRLERHKRLAEAIPDGQRAEAALAWLCHRRPEVCFLPGPTSAGHAATCAPVPPDPIARDALDAVFDEERLWRTDRAERRPPPRRDERDVIIVMGAPGAGKTTRAQHFTDAGAVRLNRDARGGRLDGLIAPLEAALQSGATRVVLDNTYPRRAQRNRVVEAAWRNHVPVRLEHVDTNVDRCLTAACARLIEQSDGVLPEPTAFHQRHTAQPVVTPAAVRNYFKMFEPPDADEGFADISVPPYAPRGPAHQNVIVVDADTLALASHPARCDALRERAASGAVVVAYHYAPPHPGQDVTAARDALAQALGPAVHIVCCPHGAPPRCWCMKPLPGAPLAALMAARAWPAAGVVVGDSAADKTWARRLGLAAVGVKPFFSDAD